MSSNSQEIRRTILSKWHETLSKYGNLFSSDSVSGTSPPSVFVGSHNYPKVFVGPMVPPIHGNTELLDSPEKWKGKTLEEIINFRLNLVRGIQKIYNFAKIEVNKSKDIGKKEYLFNYSNKHYLDATLLILVTDKLNLFFSNSNFLFRSLRRSGLAFFSKSKLARNIFRNYATKGSLLSIKND